MVPAVCVKTWVQKSRDKRNPKREPMASFPLNLHALKMFGLLKDSNPRICRGTILLRRGTRGCLQAKWKILCSVSCSYLQKLDTKTITIYVLKLKKMFKKNKQRTSSKCKKKLKSMISVAGCRL